MEVKLKYNRTYKNGSEQTHTTPSMKGKINMNFNLGMDEIGYIIPISQWDRKKPFTYSYKEAPYGEIYIGDPNASPQLYRESVLLLERLHQVLD